MKKRFVAFVLFVVVIAPLLVAAENTATSPCSGFWGSVNCFLWGNAELRGKALAGKAGELPPAAQANIYELDRASWRGKDAQGREYYQGPASEGWTYYRVTDSSSGNYYIYKEYTASDPARGYIPLPDFVGAKIGTEPFKTDAQMLASIGHPLEDSAQLIYGTLWTERERAGVVNVNVLTSAEFPAEEGSEDIAVARLPTSASPTTTVAGREGPATRADILGGEGVPGLPGSEEEESPPAQRYIATTISRGREAVYDSEDHIWRYGQGSDASPINDPSDLGTARVQLASQGRLPGSEIAQIPNSEWQQVVTQRNANLQSGTPGSYHYLTPEQEVVLPQEILGEMRTSGIARASDGTIYYAGNDLLRQQGNTREKYVSNNWLVDNDEEVAFEQAVAAAAWNSELEQGRMERGIVAERVAWASLGGTPSYINNEVHVGENEYYEEDGTWYRRRNYWFDEKMGDTTSQQLAEYRENKQWEMVAEQTGDSSNINLVSGGWREQGIESEEALAWVEAGVHNPVAAKDLKDQRLNPKDEAVALYVRDYGGEERLAEESIVEDTGSAGDVGDIIIQKLPPTVTVGTSTYTYEQRNGKVGNADYDSLYVDSDGNIVYYKQGNPVGYKEKDKDALEGTENLLVTKLEAALKRDGDVLVPTPPPAAVAAAPSPTLSLFQSNIDAIVGADSDLTKARGELSEAESALTTVEADFNKIPAGKVTAENIQQRDAAKKRVEDAKEKLTKAEKEAEDRLEALRKRTYPESEVEAAATNARNAVTEAEKMVKAAEEMMRRRRKQKPL